MNKPVNEMTSEELLQAFDDAACSVCEQMPGKEDYEALKVELLARLNRSCKVLNPL